MMFPNDNDIQYLQDFRVHTCLPDKVHFSVERLRKGGAKLTGKNYGGKPYGNGHIFLTKSEWERAAQLLHAPVGSVEGSENSKDVENDRPKACPEDHALLIRMVAANYCFRCGARLSYG